LSTAVVASPLRSSRTNSPSISPIHLARNFGTPASGSRHIRQIKALRERINAMATEADGENAPRRVAAASRRVAPPAPAADLFESAREPKIPRPTRAIHRLRC
jgi:hypothetical protein